jgi:hypothetical protein
MVPDLTFAPRPSPRGQAAPCNNARRGATASSTAPHSPTCRLDFRLNCTGCASTARRQPKQLIFFAVSVARTVSRDRPSSVQNCVRVFQPSPPPAWPSPCPLAGLVPVTMMLYSSRAGIFARSAIFCAMAEQRAPVEEHVQNRLHEEERAKPDVHAPTPPRSLGSSGYPGFPAVAASALTLRSKNMLSE